MEFRYNPKHKKLHDSYRVRRDTARISVCLVRQRINDKKCDSFFPLRFERKYAISQASNGKCARQPRGADH
jgi:hypothetical protein